MDQASGASERFDAIVIGAGQGGGPLATALANAGRRTAIVEAGFPGGTCVNTGCTPTKTMVASARVAALTRRAGGYGVRASLDDVDQRRVRDRTRAIVRQFREGSSHGLEQTPGLTSITGEAVFDGHKTIAVQDADGGDRTLSADVIVIDAGGRPHVPAVEGLQSVPFLTSETILELDETPEHLVVIGAGPIALEFAQMFRRFGSVVTVLNRSPRLLPREDEDVSEEVAAALASDGVTLLHETSVVSVERVGDHVDVLSERQGERRRVAGSHLLVATGRTPNSERLEPGRGGIAVDEAGYISVDERLQTNVDGVYAIGDINGGPAFTHISYDDFRILRTNLIDGGDATTTNRLVPWCIYVDPVLGRIGLTEREARDQGLDVRIASLPMDRVARAIEMDETRGLMKAVVDDASGRILGCAVLGTGGGELMTMIQLAMMGGLTARDLAGATISHPTLAESLNNLFAQVA